MAPYLPRHTVAYQHPELGSLGSTAPVVSMMTSLCLVLDTSSAVSHNRPSVGDANTIKGLHEDPLFIPGSDKPNSTSARVSG